MLQYSIGSYMFHGMRGVPTYPTTKVSIETRPGRDGATIWNLGKWGKPCDIETTLFTLNHALAHVTFASYAFATSLDPQPLTIGSHTISGGLYQVLDVSEVQVGAMLRTKIGGDGTVYQGVVVARWTLFPIATS